MPSSSTEKTTELLGKNIFNQWNVSHSNSDFRIKNAACCTKNDHCISRFQPSLYISKWVSLAFHNSGLLTMNWNLVWYFTFIRVLLKSSRPQLTFTCSNSTTEALEKRCEICSNLTIKTQERRHHRSSVFIVNSEHISHLFVVSLLLTLNK